MKYLGELEAYLGDLEDFIDYYDLPEEWFGAPDHIAVKCVDADDYEATIASYEPQAEQMTYVVMDGRRLATVKLARSLAIASFGDVSWVEVMEPRPEKVGKDVVGLEHAEFTFTDFVAVRDTLNDRNIKYEDQSNPGHTWINIVLNEKGQELKVNDRPLSAIVEHELELGQAKLL